MNRDLTLAFGRLLQIHLCSQRRAELFFQRGDLLVPRARHGSRVALGIDDSQCLAIECVDSVLHGLLRRPDRQALLFDPSSKIDLFSLVA